MSTKFKCPHCKVGSIVTINAYEPWNLEHYQCVECDSTYSIGELIFELKEELPE